MFSCGSDTDIWYEEITEATSCHFEKHAQSSNIYNISWNLIKWTWQLDWQSQTYGLGTRSLPWFIQWADMKCKTNFQGYSLWEGGDQKDILNNLVSWNIGDGDHLNCIWWQHKEMAHQCTFKLSIAKRLPRGDCENKDSNARHSFCTPAWSDVIELTMDCLLTGHVINIFWFSSESKGKLCAKNEFTAQRPAILLRINLYIQIHDQ